MPTSHFTGKLHRAMNGMSQQSYLRQTDGVGNVTDTLLVRKLPSGSTIPQQISAANGYFSNKNEGDPIAIDGNIIVADNLRAIQF